VDVPEQQAVSLGLVRDLAAALGEVAGHKRDGEAAAEHPVVIEPEPAGDEIEDPVDHPLRLHEPSLELLGSDVLHGGEQRLPRRDGVHAPQQPVERERVAGPSPLGEEALHLVASLRPLGTDAREREVTLGKLGAAAVDAIEDVHDHVDGLVLAGDLLDMQVNRSDRADGVDSLDECRELRRKLRHLHQPLDDRTDACGHDLGDIDPARIVPHLRGGIELERLALEVEIQAREGLSVAVKKLRWLAADQAVERRDPLLAVEQELDAAGLEGLVPPSVGILRLRRPYQQAAHRMLPVERVHQPANLLAVPDIAPLELGQGHRSEVDLVEDGLDLHVVYRRIFRALSWIKEVISPAHSYGLRECPGLGTRPLGFALGCQIVPTMRRSHRGSILGRRNKHPDGSRSSRPAAFFGR